MPQSDVAESPELIRDPIYDYITVSESEKRVIDSPPFQRLRRISQLTIRVSGLSGSHAYALHS